MIINVNGEKKEFEGLSVTISVLLKIQKVEQPEMVSVQLNGNFVDKNNYQGTLVSENDEVDFLYFMGGGRF